MSMLNNIRPGTLQAIAMLEVSERETVLRVAQMVSTFAMSHDYVYSSVGQPLEFLDFAGRVEFLDKTLAHLCDAILKREPIIDRSAELDELLSGSKL